MEKFKIIAMLFLFGAFAFMCKAQEVKVPKGTATDNLQLKISVGDKVLYAKFTNSKSTQDFIKQLPLILTMGDLRGREKYASLSTELSKDATVKTTFEAGDISYWLGGGLAVFYNQDNSTVKAGLIVLAHLDKGVEAFSGTEKVEVKFEAVKIK